LIDTIWLTGLVLTCVAGAAISFFRLPGTWLIVLSATACSWHFGWSRPTWQWLTVLVGLAVVAEVVELVSSAVLAKQAGASRKASWYALFGGILGMFLFTVPLPLIGTIIGGVIGCFAGAAIGEMTVSNDAAKGAKVGLFAAVGQVVGMVAKTMIAFLMAATAVVGAFTAVSP